MTETMSIIKLKEVFQSDYFLKEIKKLSFWAANIKQEAPILHILAKILHKNGYKVALEIKTKSELVLFKIFTALSKTLPLKSLP